MREKTLAEDATPEALMARQHHMEEVKTSCSTTSSVHFAADQIRAFGSRQAVIMMNVTCACAFYAASEVT